MASLTPSPKLQFFDANGAPLSGGKLYTYEAGTTTPLVTYTDYGAGTPNANPVILDSRGEASVWLGSLAYKMLLKTSADATVWTVDNMNHGDTATLAALAASGGSALVGYINGGSGAVATTVQAKLRQSVSVLDFGVNTTPGTTNMTAIIQAAHDAAVVNNFSEVVFPAGTYSITSLNWSPFITARALGVVILTTAVASGNAISISDLYGAAIAAHQGRPCKVFMGDFYLTNSNVANTAYAMFIGGATSANYAAFVEINGMFWLGFNGGVIRYGYNAIISKFYNCWAYQNAGSQISFAASVTNTGENLSFYGCTFSGTPGTQAGPLININSINGIDLHFYGCSADYLTKLNTTGNTAANLTISWYGGHMEANMASATWLSNDSLSTWLINGTLVYSPTAGASVASPMISETTGGSGTTSWTNIAYVAIASGVALMHNYGAGTRGIVDYNPTFPSGSTAPTNFVIQNDTSLIGRSGIQYYSTQWTGTIAITEFTVAQTGTVKAVRIGQMVTIYIPDFTGTSNAGTKTLTGMPAAFRPVTTQRFIASCSNSGGAFVPATGLVATNGEISFFKDLQAAAFTASGTTYISPFTFTYSLL